MMNCLRNYLKSNNQLVKIELVMCSKKKHLKNWILFNEKNDTIRFNLIDIIIYLNHLI